MSKRDKLRVAVLFGGKSAEHEVSIQSARNVVAAMAPARYELLLVGISPCGAWRLVDQSYLEGLADAGTGISPDDPGEAVTLSMGQGGGFYSLDRGAALAPVDVVFPVLHGTYGEDGTVQGLLELAGMPFVGCAVLGSAVAMDKDVSKRLLQEARLPVAPALVYDAHAVSTADLSGDVDRLGLPLFVKPANLGSSVGVVKVSSRGKYRAALDYALRFDTKVLAEAGIEGREVECAVLGNRDAEASVLGEIIPRADFYSYEAKYLDEEGATLKVPADLSAAVTERVRYLAVQAYHVLGCQGMARVDCFVKDDGDVVINEVNTIPGFTKISMYPRLWAASGLDYPALIDRLIVLALERATEHSALLTTRDK